MVNKNIRDMSDNWCEKIRFLLAITQQEQVDWLPELKHMQTVSYHIKANVPEPPCSIR